MRKPKTAEETAELEAQGPGPFRLIIRAGQDKDLKLDDALGARIRFID